RVLGRPRGRGGSGARAVRGSGRGRRGAAAGDGVMRDAGAGEPGTGDQAGEAGRGGGAGGIGARVGRPRAARKAARPVRGAAARQRRPATADVVAGVSMALVLIPQALAYAGVAGMPAHTGLYAAALAPLAAA